MGGMIHPNAARAIAQAARAPRAMAAPSRLGKERWEGLRDRLLASAESQTGKPHEWRQRAPDSDVWELVERAG